jgi:hypothetical protein
VTVHEFVKGVGGHLCGGRLSSWWCCVGWSGFFFRNSVYY